MEETSVGENARVFPEPSPTFSNRPPLLPHPNLAIVLLGVLRYHCHTV